MSRCTYFSRHWKYRSPYVAIFLFFIAIFCNTLFFSNWIGRSVWLMFPIMIGRKHQHLRAWSLHWAQHTDTVKCHSWCKRLTWGVVEYVLYYQGLRRLQPYWLLVLHISSGSAIGGLVVVSIGQNVGRSKIDKKMCGTRLPMLPIIMAWFIKPICWRHSPWCGLIVLFNGDLCWLKHYAYVILNQCAGFQHFLKGMGSAFSNVVVSRERSW